MSSRIRNGAIGQDVFATSCQGRTETPKAWGAGQPRTKRRPSPAKTLRTLHQPRLGLTGSEKLNFKRQLRSRVACVNLAWIHHTTCLTCSPRQNAGLRCPLPSEGLRRLGASELGVRVGSPPQEPSMPRPPGSSKQSGSCGATWNSQLRDNSKATTPEPGAPASKGRAVDATPASLGPQARA